MPSLSSCRAGSRENSCFSAASATPTGSFGTDPERGRTGLSKTMAPTMLFRSTISTTLFPGSSKAAAACTTRWACTRTSTATSPTGSTRCVRNCRAACIRPRSSWHWITCCTTCASTKVVPKYPLCAGLRRLRLLHTNAQCRSRDRGCSSTRSRPSFATSSAATAPGRRTARLSVAAPMPAPCITSITARR